MINGMVNSVCVSVGIKCDRFNPYGVTVGVFFVAWNEEIRRPTHYNIYARYVVAQKKRLNELEQIELKVEY